MDTSYLTIEANEDLQLIEKSAKDFAEKHIRPYVMEWDEAQYFPVDVFRKMGEQGFMGVLVPEEDLATGIFDAASTESAVVYPNPTTSQIFFGEEVSGEYTVLDAIGNVVSNGEVSTSGVSLDNLKEGVYFIRVQAEKKATVTRVVKL